jgi:Flp pilus assembly CpaF family ATPase
MTETIFNYEKDPLQIKAIRKDLFYENLLPFLKRHKETKQLDFRILVYGVNFNTEIALRLSRDILKRNTGSKFILNNLDLTDLENYYVQTNSKMSFLEFLNYLEDNAITTEDFKELIRNINKSLVRYGRNIHN